MTQFSGMWTTRQHMQALNAGTWPPAAFPIEFLIVAGGGSGCFSSNGPAPCGAGGAGGLISTVGKDAMAVKGNVYTVTVGAGGAAPGSAYSQNSGSNSVISGVNWTQTAIGGGAGGNASTYNFAAQNGGSGSGGGANVSYTNRGYGTYGQGFDGAGGTGYYGAGGAGGGAGGAASGTTFGPGLAVSITGSSVTYARGGKQAVEAGVANSGNGGNTDGVNGGNVKAGDSGIVVIRYADSYPAAAATTGSPTVTVTGGYRIYTFTGSGTITF